MKKIVKLFLVFALVSASAISFGSTKANVSGSKGDVETQVRDVSGFNSIKSSGSVDIYLKQGNTEFVKIIADEKYIDQIYTEVHNKTLHIYVKGRIFNPSVFKAEITIKNLQKIELTGSGDLMSVGVINTSDFSFSVCGSGDLELSLDAKNVSGKMVGSGDVDISGVNGEFYLKSSGSGDFEADNFRISECFLNVYGSGDIEISGSTDKLEIEHTSSGDIDCFDFKTNDCEVENSGSGDLKIFVSGNLSVVSRGSGDIYYRGNPQVNNIRVSGSGEVYNRN
jgi:hypothetical protein